MPDVNIRQLVGEVPGPQMVVHLGDPPGGFSVHSFPDGRFCTHCVPKVGFWKKGAGC